MRTEVSLQFGFSVNHRFRLGQAWRDSQVRVLLHSTQQTVKVVLQARGSPVSVLSEVVAGDYRNMLGILEQFISGFIRGFEMIPPDSGPPESFNPGPSVPNDHTTCTALVCCFDLYL